MEELTLTWFSEPLTVFNQDLSALHNSDWHTLQVPAFIKVIVGTMLGDVYAVFDTQIGVPDGNIGIRTRLQAALLRVEPENFCRVGGG